MAKKFNITRRDALKNILDFARANEFEDEETLAVLDNMLAKLATPAKNNTETVAHRQNKKLLADNLALFGDGSISLTAREFANMAPNFPLDNNGRPSIHKATAVLVQGINDGILSRVKPDRKSAPMQYTLKTED